LINSKEGPKGPSDASSRNAVGSTILYLSDYPETSMLSNADRAAVAAEETDELLKQIDSLQREDETLYNILAVDVWALAKTMDEFQPGFWSEFMKNRERALRRFMSEIVKSKPVDLRRPPFLR
jgi:hypothetical protein